MAGKAKDKEWNAIVDWFKEFQTETDRHNPYFQVLDFILQPRSKKKQSMKQLCRKILNNAELLFLQAIAHEDRSVSIGLLKQAVENKPNFPAAYYLMGIFSLQLNQVAGSREQPEAGSGACPRFFRSTLPARLIVFTVYS